MIIEGLVSAEYCIRPMTDGSDPISMERYMCSGETESLEPSHESRSQESSASLLEGGMDAAFLVSVGHSGETE